MSRLLGLLLLAGLMLLSSGCAMCCAPYDYDYPFVGGRWTRHNPTSGRVGSAFDEAGGPVDVMPAGAVIEQVPTPAPSGAPSAAPAPLPPTGQRMPAPMRSAIPRNLGDSYLP